MNLYKFLLILNVSMLFGSEYVELQNIEEQEDITKVEKSKSSIIKVLKEINKHTFASPTFVVAFNIIMYVLLTEHLGAKRKRLLSLTEHNTFGSYYTPEERYLILNCRKNPEGAIIRNDCASNENEKIMEARHFSKTAINAFIKACADIMNQHGISDLDRHIIDMEIIKEEDDNNFFRLGGSIIKESPGSLIFYSTIDKSCLTPSLTPLYIAFTVTSILTIILFINKVINRKKHSNIIEEL